MSTARRAKSDSVEAQVAAFRMAQEAIPWPATVSRLPGAADASRAAAIFASILEARHPDDWRPHDLALAAQLSNCMSQADRITQEIDIEGWTILSPNPKAAAAGQHVRNPKLDALTLISSRQLSLTRALALNGPPSDRKTVSNHARQAAGARAVQRDSDHDGIGGLLA